MSSCTMVSKEMLPGMEYRENPIVEIIEYNDYEKLQKDCIKLLNKPDWKYSGCTLVPHDPTQKCVIRIMAGDEKTKEHEMAHCHGHADTLLPWMADFDFYNNIDQE
ncbi:hypothetical protein ACFLZ5_09875 [Thermodesulfobacteriota bacterium]